MGAVSSITSSEMVPRITFVYMPYLPWQLGALSLHLPLWRQYLASLPRITLVYMPYLPRQLGALPLHLPSGRQYLVHVSLPENWYLESHSFGLYAILTKAARSIAAPFTIRSAVSSTCITSGELVPRITLVYMPYLQRQLGALSLHSPSGRHT